MKKRSVVALLIFILLLAQFTTVAFAVDRPTNTWVPTSGYAFAIDGSAYSNTVYLYMDFNWSSDARLSGLKADNNETLEMDIIFYNYDGNGYAVDWYNYNSSNNNRGVYWETNQPRPYWDTQFLDDSDERSFTVGSSDANLFNANSLYYWWGYAEKNSNGSRTKINAQRGYRLPSNVYESTWTVFAEQTSTVVPFSSWTTPGSVSW